MGEERNGGRKQGNMFHTMFGIGTKLVYIS